MSNVRLVTLVRVVCDVNILHHQAAGQTKMLIARWRNRRDALQMKVCRLPAYRAQCQAGLSFRALPKHPLAENQC